MTQSCRSKNNTGSSKTEVQARRNRQEQPKAQKKTLKAFRGNHLSQMHPLTNVCNAQPHECTLSSPCHKEEIQTSHTTHPENSPPQGMLPLGQKMQRKMSHKLSPLLTRNSSSESQTLMEVTPPGMNLPLRCSTDSKYAMKCK